MDRTCVLEENPLDNKQISEKRSVDQTCIGMHMTSHERGGSEIIPPCNLIAFPIFLRKLVIIEEY